MMTELEACAMDQFRKERDDYRKRLEVAEHRLAVVSDRLTEHLKHEHAQQLQTRSPQ